MSKTIFSKYSNDRDEQFKIRTDIIENEDGSRVVRKYGLTKLSEKHIDNMYNIYCESKEIYSGLKFELNRCDRREECVELEYVQGDSLDTFLDRLLNAGQYDEFEKNITELLLGIKDLATERFCASEEYYKVFGKNAYSKESYSMKINNIDMILSNIILHNDRWIILDYEWALPFSVPIEYILYRIAHYYALPSRKGILGNVDVYKLFEVTEGDIKVFDMMEKNFQKFIYGKNKTMWKLYENMGKEIFFPIGEIEYKKVDRLSRQIEICLFMDGEKHHFETIDAMQDKDGIISINIDVNSSVKTIIVKPAKRKCIVNILKFDYKTSKIGELKYGVNGDTLDNKYIVFDTEKPEIIFSNEANIEDVLNVEFTIVYPEDTIIENNKENFKMIKSMQTKIGDLECQVNEHKNRITCMENSTSWKVTKPIRKISGALKK